MWHFSSFFKHFQALSLDVVLGGVVGAMFVASYAGVYVDFKTYLVLGATIWLIYTLDHLLDTMHCEQAPITFRHRFHWRHYTTIWGIWSFSLIMVLSLLYKLPTATIYGGAILGGFVVIYFLSFRLLQSSKIFHKEALAALIYTLGMFVPAISLKQAPLGLDLWLLFVEIFVIALINLFIFSIFERSIDKEDGYHSLVLSMNVKTVKSITWGLIVAVFVLTTFGYLLIPTANYWLAQVIIGSMNIILAMILLKGDFFVLHSRYRLVGDAVFALPVIYLLFHHVI